MKLCINDLWRSKIVKTLLTSLMNNYTLRHEFFHESMTIFLKLKMKQYYTRGGEYKINVINDREAGAETLTTVISTYWPIHLSQILNI